MADSNVRNLSDFASTYIPAENNYGAFMQSQTAGKIHDVVQSESLTEPIVATLFWDIISKTNYFKRYISEQIKFNLKNIDDIIVTRHGDNQFSLLVLVKDFNRGEIIVTNSNKCPEYDIISAYEEWSSLNINALNNMEYDLADNYGLDESRIANFRYLSAVFRSVTPEFIFSVFGIVNMNILITRAPEKTMTNENWIASPFHSVAHHLVNQPNSTAGIYATNNKGIFGVTICLHSIKDPCIKKKIEINGTIGEIISIDKISDSCFVKLDIQKTPSGLTPCSGPLQVLPIKGAWATFDGMTSGKQNASIDQWNPELLSPIRENQRAVYTNAVTDGGDSGAALMDAQGKVIGFSFLRSGISEEPGYSKWIWADSVFQAHYLKY